jgi:acetoin:2,6-dichlorophenolindophenol oxidoreductase subunit alpha
MYLTSVIERAKVCRAFELSVFEQIKLGNIKVPTYLSAGQEMIACSLSVICDSLKISPMIFAQHRAHSTYLSFGGSLVELIDELLGLTSGCAGGMGGSASIHSPPNIFGHSGLMGDNAPIGVGACYASKKPTIVVVGDAACEEDYFLASLGWAASKRLPILFVVEDNNYSILTEKKIRRTWSIAEVANGFGMSSFDIEDNFDEIENACIFLFTEPILINIKTVRKFWHAGAGQDGDPKDKLKDLDIGKELRWINQIWQNRLEVRSRLSVTAI